MSRFVTFDSWYTSKHDMDDLLVNCVSSGRGEYWTSISTVLPDDFTFDTLHFTITASRATSSMREDLRYSTCECTHKYTPEIEYEMCEEDLEKRILDAVTLSPRDQAKLARYAIWNRMQNKDAWNFRSTMAVRLLDLMIQNIPSFSEDFQTPESMITLAHLSVFRKLLEMRMTTLGGNTKCMAHYANGNFKGLEKLDQRYIEPNALTPWEVSQFVREAPRIVAPPEDWPYGVGIFNLALNHDVLVLTEGRSFGLYDNEKVSEILTILLSCGYSFIDLEDKIIFQFGTLPLSFVMSDGIWEVRFDEEITDDIHRIVRYDNEIYLDDDLLCKIPGVAKPPEAVGLFGCLRPSRLQVPCAQVEKKMKFHEPVKLGHSYAGRISGTYIETQAFVSNSQALIGTVLELGHCTVEVVEDFTIAEYWECRHLWPRGEVIYAKLPVCLTGSLEDLVIQATPETENVVARHAMNKFFEINACRNEWSFERKETVEKLDQMLCNLWADPRGFATIGAMENLYALAMFRSKLIPEAIMRHFPSDRFDNIFAKLTRREIETFSEKPPGIPDAIYAKMRLILDRGYYGDDVPQVLGLYSGKRHIDFFECYKTMSDDDETVSGDHVAILTKLLEKGYLPKEKSILCDYQKYGLVALLCETKVRMGEIVVYMNYKKDFTRKNTFEVPM